MSCCPKVTGSEPTWVMSQTCSSFLHLHAPIKITIRFPFLFMPILYGKCGTEMLLKWYLCLYTHCLKLLRGGISAGRYTGSYRIPVFIFLTIWICKIPQYRCHLNNVWNATLLERGLFSRLHFGEDTAVCVTKRESSETEALVEWDEREEVIYNIHIDRHKYPPSAA